MQAGYRDYLISAIFVPSENPHYPRNYSSARYSRSPCNMIHLQEMLVLSCFSLLLALISFYHLIQPILSCFMTFTLTPFYFTDSSFVQLQSATKSILASFGGPIFEISALSISLLTKREFTFYERVPLQVPGTKHGLLREKANAQAQKCAVASLVFNYHILGHKILIKNTFFGHFLFLSVNFVNQRILN